MHKKGDTKIITKVLLGLMLGIFITIVLLAPIKMFYDKLQPEKDDCDNRAELQKIADKLKSATDQEQTISFHNNPCNLVTFSGTYFPTINPGQSWQAKVGQGYNLLCLCKIDDNTCQAARNMCITLDKPINEQQFSTQHLSQTAFITVAQDEDKYILQDYTEPQAETVPLLEETA